MTEKNQTTADLADDRDALQAALGKADLDRGSLADRLHSVFFHTLQRLDRHEANVADPYRAMPLNQIVGLADWYVENADPQPTSNNRMDFTEGETTGATVDDIRIFMRVITAQRDMEQLIERLDAVGELIVDDAGDADEDTISRFQEVMSEHPNAADMQRLATAQGLLDMFASEIANHTENDGDAR